MQIKGKMNTFSMPTSRHTNVVNIDMFAVSVCHTRGQSEIFAFHFSRHTLRLLGIVATDESSARDTYPMNTQK